MKRIKKILSIVFVLAIMASVCIVPASAATGNTTIQPRATCGYCGAHQSYTYGTWTTYKTEKTSCSHYQYGYDYKYYDRRLVTAVCSGCSNGDSTSYQYRTRSVCDGYPLV